MILLIYNYSQEVRDLFYTDSIRKKLTINLSENPIDFSTYNRTYFDIYKSLSDDEIISESMEFSEALSEENKFTFRAFSLPQLSVDRVFEEKDFTGCACTCILSIYEEDNQTIAANIMLLSGYVVSDEASDDRQTRKLNCIDSIGQLLEKEIFSFENVNKTNSSILKLISAVSTATKISFFKGDYDENGVLDYELITETNFSKLKYDVDFTNFENSYTLKGFIQDLCEITGCFIVFHKQNSTSLDNSYIGKEIIFVNIYMDLQLLYPYQTIYPDDDIYPLLGLIGKLPAKPSVINKIDWYIKAVTSTRTVIPYDGFTVYIGNRIIYKEPLHLSAFDLEYKINNNVLLENAKISSMPNILDGLFFSLISLNYFTAKLDMPYLAYLQPGDFLMFDTQWGTYILPIVKVEVKGINSMTARVTCELTTQ